MFTAIDTYLVSVLNLAASGKLAPLAIIAASWLIYPLGALVLLPLVAEKQRARGLLFFCRIAAGALAAYVVRVLIAAAAFRPRPFVVISGINKLVEKSAESPAFPSGHAAAAFAIAFGLYLWDRRAGTLAFILAAFVAVGRVAVGVHYPSDVVAGALLGILASWLVWRATMVKKNPKLF